MKVILGPLKLTLYPAKKKEKTKPEPEAKTEKPPVEEQNLPKPPQPPKPEKSKDAAMPAGGSLKEFLPFVKLALDLLGDFRRKLRIDNLYLRLILAGGDPCDLAVNYGRTWAALGNLIPQLERLFVIKKRDVEAECDFTASEPKVIARVDLTITLGSVLALAVTYGYRALKEFLTMKKRKGGAEK